MQYVLALDQGTSSSRAIVFDGLGRAVSTAQQTFEQIFPQPGWVEHDAEEIWRTQAAVMREAVESAALSPADFAAVGITNQRETTVIWERATGRPIHNAIVWQDRRTTELCDQLAEHADLFRARTGLPLDPYFSGTKVRWLLDHVPGARRRAEAGELAFGTIDTWLAWQLSAGALHVTDVSNASRTLMFDIHRGCWDEELLQLLGVPAALLPDIRGSSEVLGDVVIEPLAGVPLAGIAGDQQAALYGQRCTSPGMLKNTYGTGCFLLMHTGREPVTSQNGLLTTVAWKVDDVMEYALEGSVFIGGALIQWLRDGLGIISRAGEIEALAASVPDSGGVTLVPALAGLGAPYWDPHARGTLCGLSRGTTTAHIARAALEGIAMQVLDVLTAMQEDAGLRVRELRVDGGMSANDLLLQIQADLTGMNVVRPRALETTALGAALLAGRATGYWSTGEAMEAAWSEGRRFAPSADRGHLETIQRDWRKGVQRARDWAES